MHRHSNLSRRLGLRNIHRKFRVEFDIEGSRPVREHAGQISMEKGGPRRDIPAGA